MRLKNSAVFLLISLKLLAFANGQASATCETTSTTFYDGYLDTYINYATFERQKSSHFTMTNPFTGLTAQSTGSIQMWVRGTSSGYLQDTLSLFECGSAFSAKIINGVVTVQLQMQSAPTGVLPETTILTAKDILSNVEVFNQWNSFAFSFKSQTLKFHFNGNFVGQMSFKQTQLNTSPEVCILGNAEGLEQGIDGHMRHVVFSKEGFDATNVNSKIRSKPLPSDANILAYHEFQKDFGLVHETFFANQQRQYYSNNVFSRSASLPESVCYCTIAPSSYLKLNSTMQDLPMFNLTQQIDCSGVTVSMTLFAIKSDDPSTDQIILQIPKYLDLVLTNYSQTLRVDIYSGDTVSQSITFSKFRFRFNFWTSLSFTLTSKSATLKVDSVQVETQNTAISFPSSNPKNFNLTTAQNLTYLIGALQIADSTANKVAIDLNFTQQVLVRQFQGASISVSSLQFEANNRLCSLSELATPSSFIATSGDTCKDPRLYPLFGATNTTQTSLTGLKITYSKQQTYELWIKDQKVPSINDTLSVILESTDGTKNLYKQFAIVTNSSNLNQRNLNIYTTRSIQAAKVLNWTTTNRTYNHWIHLSIVSDGLSLVMNVYNGTTRNTQTFTSQTIAFENVNDNNFALGSSISGANKFNGFIREFRVWAATRTLRDIELLRFTSNIDSRYSKLTYYFKLDDGGELFRVKDVIIGLYLQEKSLNTTSLTYQQETNLIICKPGQYYNGACCTPVNITGVDFTFSYTPSKAFIVAQVTTPTNMAATLSNSILANFSVVSLGYEQDSTVNSTVRKLFTVNQASTFNVSSLLINPVAYTITIQAKIYSIFSDGPSVIVRKTLSFQCPNYYISINNETISSTKESQYLVSTQADTSIILQVRPFQNQSLCYNPKTMAVDNITINSLNRQWYQNLSVANKALTINAVWDISTDNTTLTYKQVSTAGQKWTRLFTRLLLSNGASIDVAANLTYTSTWPVNAEFSTNSFIRNYLMTKPISIDFSKFTSSDAANYPTLAYSVQCPSEIFQSVTQQTQLCKMDTSTFSLATSSLKITSHQKYNFTMFVGIKGTNIIRKLTASVAFYQDGTNQAGGCPILVMQTGGYTYDKATNQTQNIITTPYFYCNGTFFEPRGVEWTALDNLTSKALNGLVVQNGTSLNANILNTNLLLNNLVGGTTIRLSAKVTAVQGNATQIFMPLKSAVYTSNANLTVIKNPLKPVVQMLNYLNQTISTFKIPFLDPNVTLSASQSFDPDNSSAILSYNWACPSKIDAGICKSLFNGTRNSTLLIPLWLKMYSNLGLSTNHTYILTVTNPFNPYSTPAQLAFNVSFDPPQKQDLINKEIQATSCETLKLDSNSFQSGQTLVSNGQLIEFKVTNWDSHIITSTSQLDGNVQTTKSPCGFGVVEQQYQYLYAFDGLLPTDSALRPMLSQTKSPTLLVTRTILSSDFTLLKTILADIPIQVHVYHIVKRAGTNRVFVNLQRFYFYRKYDAVVAVLSPDVISIDQYYPFTLDGSNSYDSEDQSTSGLTYIWECPSDNKIQTCAQNKSKITINYKDRLSLGSNQVSQIYEYKLTVKKGERTSQSTVALVTITERDDYTNCMEVNQSLTFDTLSYDFEGQNRTIYLDRGQDLQFIVDVSASPSCDSAEVMQTRWFSINTDKPFYYIDENDNKKVHVSTKNISMMQPGQLVTLIYQIPIYLANDKSRIYLKTAFINFQISPANLVPVLKTLQLIDPSKQSTLVLDASGTIDNQNRPFTCKWSCPDDEEDTYCSENCKLEMPFTNMKQKIYDKYNEDLSYFYDASLPYTVDIISDDGERSVSQTSYVYLFDQYSSSPPLNETGIENCTINLYGMGNVNTIWNLVSQELVFYMKCDQENLTSYLLDPIYFVTTWKVWGLIEQTDYYNKSGQLFIRPYSLSKLEMEAAHSLISVTIQSLLTNSTTTLSRILQEDNQLTDQSTEEEQPIDGTKENQDGSNADNGAVDSGEEQGQSDNSNSEGGSESPTPPESPEPETPPEPESPTEPESPPGPESPPEPETPPEPESPTEPESPETPPEPETPPTEPETPPTEPETPPPEPETPSVPESPPEPETPSTPTPPPVISKKRKYTDRAFYTSLTFKRKGLILGEITATTRSSTQEAYLANYTFTFSGFETNPKSTILFQTRASYDLIYNTSQIIIPLKLFNQEALDSYYDQTYMPWAPNIYVDFFDGGLNYLGSQDLKATGGALEQMRKLGQPKFAQANSIITSIWLKATTGYWSDDDKSEFDADMKRLLEFSELVALDSILGATDVTISDYIGKINQYLKFNFRLMLLKFDSTDLFQYRQKLINQKRGLLILYNLISRNQDLKNQVVSVQDIFIASVENFEDLCYNSGEDSNFIRTVVLWMANQFKVQLASVNLANKQQYYDKLYDIQSRVYQSDAVKNNATEIKVQQETTSVKSRTVYKISTDSQSAVAVSNANNPKEQISFSLPEGILKQRANVSQLTVEYDVVDSSMKVFNLSSNSLITIKGFDSSGKQVDVNFTGASDAYFSLNMSISDAAKKTLSAPKMKIKCVYFDEKRSTWGDDGISVDGYDNKTGIVSCRSTHLTQFGAQTVNTSAPAPVPPSPSPNPNPNPTPTPTPTPEPEGNLTKLTSTSHQTYYQEHKDGYVAVIVVVTVLCAIFVTFSIKCCLYTHTKPMLQSTDGKPPKDISMVLQIWAVFKVYNPLVSSIFPQVQPILAMPRVLNLLSFFIYIFSIVLSALIHLVYIAESQEAYNSTSASKYGILYLVCLIILRPIMNKLQYGLYMQYATIKHGAIPNPPYSTTTQRDHTSENKSFNIIQMEGGSREEHEFIDDSESGPSSQQHPNTYHSVGGRNAASPNPLRFQEESKFSEIQDIPGKIMPTMNNRSLIYSAKSQGTPDATIDYDEDNRQAQLEEIHLEIIPPALKWPPIQQDIHRVPQKKPDSPPSASVITRQTLYDGHEKTFAHLQPISTAMPISTEVKEQQKDTILIENEHNFKGTRALLFISRVVVVACELIAIYAIMKEIEDDESMTKWVRTCAGLCTVYMLIVDPLLSLAYGILIGQAKTHGVMTVGQALLSGILGGNSDYRARLSACLEMKA